MIFPTPVRTCGGTPSGDKRDHKAARQGRENERRLRLGDATPSRYGDRVVRSAQEGREGPEEEVAGPIALACVALTLLRRGGR